jgi:hypothetical protein
VMNMSVSFAVRFFKYLAMILAYRIRNTRSNTNVEKDATLPDVPVITISDK